MTPILTTNYTGFGEDENLRSPRSPNWAPTTPSLTSPFDYTKFFATSPSETTDERSLLPPPDNPLPWIWQCHLCRNRYPLNVTRRCLYDGHYYCSGETDRPNLRKKKKGLACSSEFDYDGWEDFVNWRQHVLKAVDNPRVLAGCEACAFPSQCRTPTALHPPKKSKKVTTLHPPKATEAGTQTTIDPRLLAEPQGASSTAPHADMRSQSTHGENAVSMQPRKESKVQSLVDSLYGNMGQTSARSEKTVRKRLRKQHTTIATIEEDSRQEVVSSLHDLVLPVMDNWSSRSNEDG